MAISDKIAARIKVMVQKPLKNPDDRLSLCGEAFTMNKAGRQCCVIPAHTAEYQKKLFPHYEFSEEYEIKEAKAA